MLHFLVIGVNRRTRNTYSLIRKVVGGTGDHLADEKRWLKNKKIQISHSNGRTWSVMAYTSCLALEVNSFCR